MQSFERLLFVWQSQQERRVLGKRGGTDSNARSWRALFPGQMFGINQREWKTNKESEGRSKGPAGDTTWLR